jgi:hypothetical protein
MILVVNKCIRRAWTCLEILFEISDCKFVLSVLLQAQTGHDQGEISIEGNKWNEYRSCHKSIHGGAGREAFAGREACRHRLKGKEIDQGKGNHGGKQIVSAILKPNASLSAYGDFVCFARKEKLI